MRIVEAVPWMPSAKLVRISVQYQSYKCSQFYSDGRANNSKGLVLMARDDEFVGAQQSFEDR